MPYRKKPIVIAGSINIDLVALSARIPLAGETVPGSNFQIYPGGKGANQAVAVARLGYPVRLIGRLGEDAFGAQLRACLEREQVDIAGVLTTPAASGVAVIVVSERGENTIVVVPGANALLTPADLEASLETIRSAGLVLTQLEIPEETVASLASICHRENVPLILDPAPARHLPPSVLERVTWFTPNETEAAFFLGSREEGWESASAAPVARMLVGLGVQGVVLKMGARGAYVTSMSGLGAFIDPFPADAIDTTGAGDAFNGAFATGLMLSKGPVESARFAAAAAAISIARAGAQTSMAAMEEVDQMLKRAQCRK